MIARPKNNTRGKAAAAASDGNKQTSFTTGQPKLLCTTIFHYKQTNSSYLSCPDSVSPTGSTTSKTLRQWQKPECRTMSPQPRVQSRGKCTTSARHPPLNKISRTCRLEAMKQPWNMVVLQCCLHISPFTAPRTLVSARVDASYACCL